eukprot:4421351-Amphidinium_carterae.8
MEAAWMQSSPKRIDQWSCNDFRVRECIQTYPLKKQLSMTSLFHSCGWTRTNGTKQTKHFRSLKAEDSMDGLIQILFLMCTHASLPLDK